MLVSFCHVDKCVHAIQHIIYLRCYYVAQVIKPLILFFQLHERLLIVIHVPANCFNQSLGTVSAKSV